MKARQHRREFLSRVGAVSAGVLAGGAALGPRYASAGCAVDLITKGGFGTYVTAAGSVTIIAAPGPLKLLGLVAMGAGILGSPGVMDAVKTCVSDGFDEVAERLGLDKDD